MKRFFLVLLLIISCIAVMTACSQDPKKRFLTFESEDDGVDNGGGETVFNGPTSVAATDGNYRTKVGINWATVSNAVSYNIYRADSEAGPFTTKIGSVAASTLVNVDTNTVSSLTPATVATTATGGTCDVPVYQAVYQSVRDIGDGIFLPAGVPEVTEHYDIGIEIGGVNLGSVLFKGDMDTWNWSRMCFGTWWTQDKIVQKMNAFLGSNARCYPVTVNNKKYIKIVSSNSIRLTNHYNLLGELLWPGLDFFDQSSNNNTVINVQRVMIACNDITPPTVMLTSPASGATDIALNAKLSVAFSEPITQTTLNESTFTLTAGGSPVEGTVSNNGIFTPSNELVPNTQYTATITAGVTDLSGNHLASNYVWSFTTSAAVSYYYVDVDVTEGSHYYYVVTAVDKDGKESTMSPVEEGFTKANDNVPSKVPSCSASDGLAGGVTVTWGAAANATYYKVYRIDSTGQMTQVGGNISGTSYTDTTVGPGVFSYKVSPFNTYGEGGSSEKDAGYRAVTNQEFFDLVYKEEESALNKSPKLASQSTGTDNINGAISGTCVVNITGSLSSATVSITFTNYCDIFLKLNGSQLTSINNPLGSKTGTVTGQINATGVYNGYVKFNLGISNAVVTSGTYTVSQDGGTTETTIPYSYVPAD
ncbi:MAG TPA: Ig-like domain-containing protein [Spirochaetota bacterium]|nr:Ig-like domain-containing protein [Spirochaetota bacterium]HPC40250.1 Ig-like domain-containing protein [Spirochaetota bacterium]HPL18312.1 Ig-like domain-containing protein [Spirochaetota bacterium]HRS76079.1 Ig-like domain-containing protein [Spirochaetota bacterium]HRT73743.1 Ig-like domain-containing protein [Spirochaetota bacterium]